MITESLLQGFNCFSSDGRFSALQLPSGVAPSSNPRSTCRYKICTSFYELAEVINISASASSSFVYGTVNDKMNFVHSLNITQTSVIFAAYAATSTVHSFGGAQLTLTVDPPPTDALTFYTEYGDSFVSEIEYGSEYIACYVFYAKTEDEQTMISNSLTASGVSAEGTLTVSLAASFTTAVQSITAKTFATQVQFGSGLPYPQLEPSPMLNFAVSFPTEASTSSTNVMSYNTDGYETLPALSSIMQKIAATRAIFDTPNSSTSLPYQLNALQLQFNQLTGLQQVYQAYGYENDNSISIQAQALYGDLQTGLGLAKQMTNDPTQSYTLPSFSSLAKGVPSLNFNLSLGPVLGGTNAPSSFTDVQRANIESGMLLSAVQVYGGNKVDSIVLTYSYPGGASLTNSHGGSGGSPCTPFELAPNETITKISYTLGTDSGGEVYQLTFETSKSNSYGPFPGNPDSGTAMTWPSATQPLPQGATVVGFAGYYGWYLNGLQPQLLVFSPATWPSKSAASTAGSQ